MHPLNVLVLVVNTGSSPCVCAEEEEEEEEEEGAGEEGNQDEGRREEQRREEKAGRTGQEFVSIYLREVRRWCGST